MQASSTLKNPYLSERCNGTDLECEWSYVFRKNMAYQGSTYSHYKPQKISLKESIDTQLLPSKVFSENSVSNLDPALLYSSWSVFTDDVKPAATFTDGNLSRPRVNLSYSGNGPDVFGMVSSILEEPNPEHLGDWNSSSKLFPLWAADNDQTGQQEKIVQFGNGSSDVIDISNFYQDAFHKMEGGHMDSLYHGFQGLDLMDTWLLGGKKVQDLGNLDSTHFTSSSCNQDALLNEPSYPRDDFGFNKRVCDPCMQDGSQEVLNGSFEKIPGEFGMYACHNRSNSNNTRLQKEFTVEQGRDKFSKSGSSMEQTRFPCDPSSPPQREKWHHMDQQRQYSFRGYEDYTALPPQRKTFSTSQSHYSIPHNKVNGRAWKTGDHFSSNLQSGYLSSRKLNDQCQMNAVDSPCKFTPAGNLESRNGDYLHPGKSRPLWSEGDVLSSSWKSSLQNGKKNSPGYSTQASLSGSSNVSSNGNLANHLLTPSPTLPYRSHTSPVSPEGRQDRRSKPGEGRPGAWPRGMTPGNANLNASGSHSRLDPSVTKDHHNQHGYHCSWSGASTGEEPDKYLYNPTKHNPDGHDDGKGIRKNNNWFPPSNAYGGPSRHQYNSNNNYWRKQDQERSCTSDFSSAHFSPPLQLDLKSNPSLAQFGLHSGVGGGGSSGGFPLPQSALPFPDLMEMLQSEDLSHLSPFVNELLNGDVPPPYFGFPPLFNKYRPMRNRSGPANELHVQLELCYEQWRTLEKERKKTEANLARNFPGRRVSSSNNTPIPCLPANPSRVDRLIVDQLREQARVVALVGKMERLRSAPVHANITTTLERYLEAIRFTQQRRKDEIVNTANRQRQGAPRYSDDKDVLALAAAIKELAMLTRKARTALWCALQMTLPKGVLGMAARQAELERALLELCNPGDGELPVPGVGETQPPTGASSDKKEAGPRGGREAKAPVGDQGRQ